MTLPLLCLMSGSLFGPGGTELPSCDCVCVCVGLWAEIWCRAENESVCGMKTRSSFNALFMLERKHPYILVCLRVPASYVFYESCLLKIEFQLSARWTARHCLIIQDWKRLGTALFSPPPSPLPLLLPSPSPPPLLCFVSSTWSGRRMRAPASPSARHCVIHSPLDGNNIFQAFPPYRGPARASAFTLLVIHVWRQRRRRRTVTCSQTTKHCSQNINLIIITI